VVHVLTVESSKYEAALASGDDLLLVGQSCARCGSCDLELTDCWLSRGLQTTERFKHLRVCLARCESCDSRERVLPSNALPGKTNDVENIFTALAAVERGIDIDEVARTHHVTGAGLRKWMRGAAHRYLDLAVLYRHRAMIAPSEQSSEDLLVRFWAVVSWISSDRVPAALSQVTPEQEEREAMAALLALLEEWGGALAVAKRGSGMVGQAVLLFRGGGINTPSFLGSEESLCETADARTASNVEEEPGAQSDRCLAARTDRRRPRRTASCRCSGPDLARHQQGTRALALGPEQEDLTLHTLPLGQGLRIWWARGPPAKAA